MIDGFGLRMLTPFARAAVVAHVRMSHMGRRRKAESAEDAASRQAWGEELLAKLASNEPEEFDDPYDYARLTLSLRHLLISMQVAEQEFLNVILNLAIDPGGIDEDPFASHGGSP